ncbi:MAG: hypothetical protein Q9173_003973 [Seirophora scorigena]
MAMVPQLATGSDEPVPHNLNSSTFGVTSVHACAAYTPPEDDASARRSARLGTIPNHPNTRCTCVRPPLPRTLSFTVSFYAMARPGQQCYEV